MNAGRAARISTGMRTRFVDGRAEASTLDTCTLGPMGLTNHTPRSLFRVAVAGLLSAGLAGCPETPSVPDGGDTGRTDAPSSDTGMPDTGMPDTGPVTAPIFRSSVTMADRELANEALRLMGAPEAGGSESCHGCHGITRESIAHFRELSDAAWTTCLSDLDPDSPSAAADIVACFRQGSSYSASRLGIYASGAYNPWFEYIFDRADPAGGAAAYERFLMRAGMPPAGHTAFTQAEFNLVTEWFLRGTPFVDAILPVIEPSDCTPSISPSVGTIIADSATTGWSARNLASGILMHGCAGAASPEACLGTYPLAADRPIGTGWAIVPGSHARILFEAPYTSSYWTRSSADGRFVAHGGGRSTGASVIDLLRGVDIGADAAFDPGFFPDNSGIMFQGTPSGTAVCEQSVLSAGSPTHISFTEAGCTGAINVALYQHMGASLDGGDYWAVNSGWSGDPGGNGSDPTLFVDAGSSVTFIAMRNSGTGFTPGDATTVTTPFEASAVLSPSARMMVTQIADASSVPVGYVLRRVDVTRDASGNHTIAVPEIARYCFPGGKPSLSLDDRWLVTHHRATDADAVDLGFTGPSDPAFAPYRGISNLYLVDLTTGVRTRITHMAPDQQALFPHFRSDGWIYFQVRTDGLPEYTVASDAALVLAD